MIERIRFKNFKALKDAEVKLGPFNLIVGPNGSGKSSLLQAFEVLAKPNHFGHRQFRTLGANVDEYSIELLWSVDRLSFWCGTFFTGAEPKPRRRGLSQPAPTDKDEAHFWSSIKSSRVYALEPSKMANSVNLSQVLELSRTGDNLAGALTHLSDQGDESYDQMREELQRWLPEFDSIIFKNDQNSQRSFSLRQASTRQPVPAQELSEGTLLSLALLTIIYQPSAPTVIGLEEPDRGLHPRLLREVRDALYRLAFPSDFGLKRKPVQVIATTHSPLFLDLFKDHPEQIIIAEKNADGTASFRNLADDKELIEMIGDTPLGEVWYSGVLGGVPALK